MPRTSDSNTRGGSGARSAEFYDHARNVMSQDARFGKSRQGDEGNEIEDSSSARTVLENAIELKKMRRRGYRLDSSSLEAQNRTGEETNRKWRIKIIGVVQWVIIIFASLLGLLLGLGYAALFVAFVVDSLGWHEFEDLNQAWPLAVALIGLGVGSAIIPIRKLFERVGNLEEELDI